MQFPYYGWWDGLAGEAYLTLDIDAFGPAAAPGTGFAEPGGLGSRDVARLIRGLARRVRLRGIDLVEVNPFSGGARRIPWAC
jgi:arginase family enzyme